MTHHAPQRRPGEQLEADDRRHGVAGEAEHRGAVEHPEREGLRRFDRDLHPSHVGDVREDGLHHVVVAHADAAARDDGVALGGSLTEHCLQRRLIVGHDAEVDRGAAGLSDGADEHRLVALPDLAGPQRPSVGDQLVAGREHGDPGPGMDEDRSMVDARQHAEHRRAHDRAGGEQQIAADDVVADVAEGVARPNGAIDADHAPSSIRSVSSTMTTASAPSGIGAPVMMRIASPRPTGTSAAAPAATVATTGSSTGASVVSSARTAYPSTALFTNGGTSSSACRSSAVTQPSASTSGRVTGGNGRHAAITWASASWSSIIGMTVPARP